VEAEQSVRAALLIAPASPTISIVGANTFRIMGLFEESVGICRTMISMRPDQALFHSVAALSLFQLNRREEALIHAREAARLAPHSATGMQMQFLVYHAAGDIGAAREMLDRLIAWHRTTQYIAQWISGVFHHTGDFESSLDWLEEAERVGEYWYPFTAVEKWAEAIHEHPRYQALVARIRAGDGKSTMLAPRRVG
jgi:tetratricopeptide (TPR) repeat protein